MAEPIGPGDWVECIELEGDDDEPVLFLDGLFYQVGGIYLVSEVGEKCDGPWLHCDGHVRPVDLTGWSTSAFRPIYRPRASLIESLKAPPKRAPKRQREEA